MTKLSLKNLIKEVIAETHGMKVYIVYGKGGYDDQIVDRVFSSEDVAREYVIQSRFYDNAHYDKMSTDQLNAEADLHIHKYIVD